MSIASGIVLFLVIWFTVLFVILPIRIRTQGDEGDVVPGTPTSAPTDPMLSRKAKLVTVVTVLIWLPVCAVIASGLVSPDDFNFYRFLGAPTAEDGY